MSDWPLKLTVNVVTPCVTYVTKCSMLSRSLQQMGLVASSPCGRSRIPGERSHAVPSASRRECFGLYPRVKQAPQLCTCLVAVAVIAQVTGGLGKEDSSAEGEGEQLAQELCGSVHF